MIEATAAGTGSTPPVCPPRRSTSPKSSTRTRSRAWPNDLISADVRRVKPAPRAIATTRSSDALTIVGERSVTSSTASGTCPLVASPPMAPGSRSRWPTTLLAGRPGSLASRRSGGGSSISPGGLALLVRSICRRAGPGPSTSPPPSPGCGRSRSRPDAARPRRPLHCLAPACLRAPPHRRLLLSARPDSNRRTLPAPPTAPAPPKTTVSRSTARATQTVGGFGLKGEAYQRAATWPPSA